MKRMFHVQGSIPPGSGNPKSYATHVIERVIASDIKRAIVLVEEAHPGVVIHNVQHHGIVTLEEP